VKGVPRGRLKTLRRGAAKTGGKREGGKENKEMSVIITKQREGIIS